MGNLKGYLGLFLDSRADSIFPLPHETLTILFLKLARENSTHIPYIANYGQTTRNHHPPDTDALELLLVLMLPHDALFFFPD